MDSGLRQKVNLVATCDLPRVQTADFGKNTLPLSLEIQVYGLKMLELFNSTICAEFNASKSHLHT